MIYKSKIGIGHDQTHVMCFSFLTHNDSCHTQLYFHNIHSVKHVITFPQKKKNYYIIKNKK